MADRIAILMYHQVGKFPPPKRRHLYCHHERFAAQMAFLHRFGYHVLGMDEVIAGLRGEQAIPARAVALTFDDGYDNFQHFALPVLQCYGFKATVYALAGQLGRTATWYPADVERPRLMDGRCLRELTEAGVAIGAHGVEHLRLTELDGKGLGRQLSQSKDMLQQLLGQEVRHFCYPFGSYNRTVIEATRAAGYASAVTCDRGMARRGSEPLALPRQGISYYNGLVAYFWKVGF